MNRRWRLALRQISRNCGNVRRNRARIWWFFSIIIAIILTADISYITNFLPTTSIIRRRRPGRLVRRIKPLAVSIILIPVQENVSSYVYFLLRCLVRSLINIFVSWTACYAESSKRPVLRVDWLRMITNGYNILKRPLSISPAIVSVVYLL